MMRLQEMSHARPEVGRVPYLPGLDGLRALAVVAVMVYHADHEWLRGGFLGVEVFFVISGYLITLLLVGEHERTGRIALKDFWVRRFRRLLPALFVMMSALAVYMAVFRRRPQGQTRGDFLGGIFYGSNWYQIFVGQGYTATEAFAPLRHLWSLAVEEQFYLVWPLLMVVLLRRGRAQLPRIGLWLFGVAGTIALLTAILFAGGDVAVTCAPDRMNGWWHLFGRCISVNESLYLSTITRASGLMLGAGFAMVWRPNAILRGPLRHQARRLDLVAGAGIALLALLMWRLWLSGSGVDLGVRFNPWLFRGGFLLTGVATLLVIAAASHQGAATGTLLGNRVFLWVGTRSYGLYLYHWPIYQIIREQAGRSLTVGQFVLAMALTVPITELSYRYVETPIRRGQLGELFRRSRGIGFGTDARRNLAVLMCSGIVLLGATVFSFAKADNVCVGDVQCSLVDAPGEPDLAAPVPTTVAAPPGSTAPEGLGSAPAGSLEPVPPTTVQPTTTTVDLDALPPIAIGESVMKGAEGVLQAAGFVVDAQESRQGTDLIAELAALRASNRLGRTVVIQIGTNGRVSDETFDAIMASLPQDLTPNVVFLTVRVEASWMEGNNQRILALPSRYPWVRIADWAAVAATVELCDDGAHISCHGAAPIQAYADLIVQAAGVAPGT